MRKRSVFLGTIFILIIMGGGIFLKYVSREKTETPNEAYQASPIAFTLIDQGSFSFEKEKKEVIIDNSDDLKKLWEEIYSPQSIPENLPHVDFQKDIVIALFLGQRPTAGYVPEIVNVIDGSSEVIVVLREKSPPPDSLQAQVVTQPYAVYTLPRRLQEKRIIFRQQP